MRGALALAGRGLGQVAPNPAVGCVLVAAGRVVGRGWTQVGGRPHAETEALARAGTAAKGATAYVTLEPCAHHGLTPPCVEALVAAGITRCLIALEDPDDRVSGRGIEGLRAAGIDVEVGLCRDEAAELNRGYLLHRTARRPLVTLKLATSLDGRIATGSGESRWITGPLSRARGHLLRATHDAILVGSGTAVADNPRLDVRLPGLTERAPLRVLLDGRLRLPLTHDLVARAAEQRTCIVTRVDADVLRLAAYSEAGLEVVQVEADDFGNMSLTKALGALADLGVTRLLVEGGGRVAAALLQLGLVDRLVWFRAAMAIGGDGVSAVASLGLERLEGCPRFNLTEVQHSGADLVECYRRMD